MEEPEKVFLRKHSYEELLKQRNELLQEVRLLKAQLVQAGLTPLSSDKKRKRFSLPLTHPVNDSEEEECPKSCGENKHSFSTYDKRSGTNDLGKQYEYIMCGYYAIRFALSSEINDFEMTTNDEVYGDFDDIAIRVKYSDLSSHSYLMQLKHTENKRGLSEKVLNNDKNFFLMKYLKSWENLTQKDNTSCILFTNRTAHFREGSFLQLNDFILSVKKFDNIFCEPLLDTNQTSKRSIYQFCTEDDESLKDFLQHFYLFTNQNNVNRMKTIITNFLKELLQCDIYDTFIHFMKSWWCGNFILTKSDVIFKLAELTLSPSIHTISNKKVTSRSHILKTAILDFDMTLIDEIDMTYVTDIWPVDEDVREISLTCLKFGLSNKGVTSIDELTEEQISRALWYLNRVPLIIKIYESRMEQIKCAIHILEKLSNKKKLIVLGTYSQQDYLNWKIFDNLSDLNKEFYQVIIKQFEISLQGRDAITLGTLLKSSTKANIIKVRELLIMAQEPLLIGDRKEHLPDFYISRTVTAQFFDIDSVLNCITTSHDLMIIITSKNIESIFKEKHLTYSNLPDFDTEHQVSILLCDDCSKAQFDIVCGKVTRRRVHLLKIVDDMLLLLLSTDNVFKNQDLPFGKTRISEKKIHDVFNNPINVLCAQPGIGKSTMIKYLDKNCPCDYWSVRVNLRKFNSLLREEPEEEEILLYFLELEDTKEKSLLQEVKTLFLKSYKIYLFLDGLDEIESNCVDFALDYVNYIASRGVHVWISSRQNLQELITNHLNIFSIDIEELNPEEQIGYIKKRLEVKYSEEEIDQISNEIFQSADVTNSHSMLGIPLQLYIITENFLNDIELYQKISKEIFVLTKMYQLFFDGKKKHLYEKVGIQCEQQLGFNFNLHLENYEIPALRCCLDDRTFQKLNIETNGKHQEFLEMINNEGDKFGIISQINEDKAVFAHQTYAEYFACLWLKKNFSKVRLLKKEFRSDKFQNLRLIFDILLAENCPLHLAVIYKSKEQVLKHLEKIYETDEGGRNVLHLISSYGSKYIPLQLEPDLFTNHLYHEENQFSGDSPEYQEIFTLLCECDPFQTDDIFKWNALDYCFQHQCLYPVERFLQQCEEKVKLDVLFDKLNSVSLVYYAVKLGYPHLLEAMIKRNRNTIRFKIGKDKLSFLHVAVKGASNQSVQEDQFKINIIRILLKNGICIDTRDKNGATALHLAVSKGLLKVVKVLLEEGAEINAINSNEETVIHYALQKWEEETKHYTSDKINSNDVLHWACKENDFELVTDLVENVDINCRNNMGETALHCAIRTWKPNLDIIELLLDKGVDVNSADYNDLTSLHWAFENGHYDIIGLLHQKGANIRSITLEHKILLKEYEPYNPNMPMIEVLMDCGFNVNIKDSNGASILHWVAEKGHLNTTKMLIANGANINACTKNKETIIHYVAKGNNPNLIPIFTEIGVDINAKDLDGITALHRAAERGNLKMVKTLLDHGANILATDCEGENALTFSVKSFNPNLHIINLLIANKIDVNSKDSDGVTVLHWACERGHLGVAKILIEKGANVNSVTKKEETPLHFIRVNPELVKLLLNKSAKVNHPDVNGMTALHCAAKRCQFDLVKTLVNHDANINLRTKKSETVLIYAAKQRKVNLEIIKLLINDCEVNATDRTGMTALHWASEKCHYDVVKLLLDKKGDVNACTHKKKTSLHFASECWQPNVQVIRKLVQVGAVINSQDDDGATPLHWACKEGHYMNVEVLIQIGGDVNAVNKDKETTLHSASKAWKSNEQVINMLIQKGVSVNDANKELKTALHFACEKGFYDNVILLLEKGADINSCASTNLTALHFAVYGGHVRIVKLLLKKGLNINKIDTKHANYPLYFAVRNGSLKEELLVMMTATIHDKFPLLSWTRYALEEVVTYLQEAQPYMEPLSLTRNASTTVSEQTDFFHSMQSLVRDNVGYSVGWLRNVFNILICRKVSNEPRTPTFIVHYPVFPSEDFRLEPTAEFYLGD